MVSQVEPPLWDSWDSCQIFGAKDHSTTASNPLSVKSVTLEHVTDQAAVLAFCQARQVSETALWKLAWCMVIGIYAGAEDVCIGITARGSQTLLRCQLNPQQTAGRLLSSMEEVFLVSKDGKEGLADMASSTGLFDTVLSIVNEAPARVTEGMGVNGTHSSVSRLSILPDMEMNAK
jgi:hypothetical protein